MITKKILYAVKVALAAGLNRVLSVCMRDQTPNITPRCQMIAQGFIQHITIIFHIIKRIVNIRAEVVYIQMFMFILYRSFEHTFQLFWFSFC